MQVVTLMGEDQIRREFRFQLLEKPYRRSYMRKETIPEVFYDNTLRFRFSEKQVRILACLSFPQHMSFTLDVTMRSARLAPDRPTSGARNYQQCPYSATFLDDRFD